MQPSDFVAYRLPHGDKAVLKTGNLLPAQEVITLQSVFCVKPFDGSDLFVFSHAETNVLNEITEEKLPLSHFTDTENPNAHSDFVKYVQQAKDTIADNKFEKVVVARKEFRKADVNAWKAFEKAMELYPNAFVYLLHSELKGTWLGASPELLLELDGQNAKTMALAGTVKGNDNFSVKETNEQGIIGKYLYETLAQSNAVNIQVTLARPDLNGGLIHLKSDVTFEISDENKAELIENLHPTPAVGGYPKPEALEFIRQFEKDGRELYAGWLGESSIDKAKLYVNLRCARLYANGAVLHAGCGINSMSDPEKEWQETCWKMDVIGKCI